MDKENYKKVLQQLVLEIKNNRFTVFAGAGISVASPTKAPTWKELRVTTLSAMLQKIIDKQWPITEYLQSISDIFSNLNIRPEAFLYYLSHYLGQQFSGSLISPINRSLPNINHNLIASLLKEGFLKNLITTNFDTYIENSLESIKSKSNYNIIIEESNIDQIKEKKYPIIYKPHGCITDYSSMIFTIQQIQKLPLWKKKLFESILSSTHILFLGYSGNDEDILPIVYEILKNNNNSYCTICKHPKAASHCRNGVGPSKLLQPTVNKKKKFTKHSKTALSGPILTPKWAF